MDGLQGNHKILNVKNEDFASLALEIFQYQASENPVYRAYLEALQLDPAKITRWQQIPYLPIRFFKSQKVITGTYEPARVFESSGTTGSIPSKHYIKDLGLYEDCFLEAFRIFYGPVTDWCILGLLPSYLERENSSLVYMVNSLILQSRHSASGFYLDDLQHLKQVLEQNESGKVKTLLIGVSFALLELAEKFPGRYSYTVIMETGGMKGRRKEMVREELHERIKKSFGVKDVHSEYGMTELMSQAYAKAHGIFHAPPWMRVVLRDEEDPFTLLRTGEIDRTRNGVINVIDLANIHSCAFIATDDAGRLHPDGSFEVLGRMDGSDLRGCSLMVLGS